MRWLLLWLHPDRNGHWDAVYAARVVKAWREFSNQSGAVENSRPTVGEAKWSSRRNGKLRRFSAARRIPLIKWPSQNEPTGRKKWYRQFSAAVLIVVGVAAILLLFR
jgi:hypothetical protein